MRVASGATAVLRRVSRRWNVDPRSRAEICTRECFYWAEGDRRCENLKALPHERSRRGYPEERDDGGGACLSGVKCFRL